MMDLHLYTINRTTGQDHQDLPGVLTMNAPKRAARGRMDEILLLSLTLSGTLTYTSVIQQEMLLGTAETYYSTPGPVTTGLRSAVNYLNDLMMKRNLKGTREGFQAVGVLNLAVMRRNLLYIAHAGGTQSQIITSQGVQQFTDLSGSERGLGISKSVSLRFYQVEIQQGDLLLMSAQPPPGWTPTSLAGSAQLNIDPLRRRLFGKADAELQAVMVRFMEGKGLVFRRRLTDSAGRSSVDITENAIPQDETENVIDANLPASTQLEIPPEPSSEQIAALENLFIRPETHRRNVSGEIPTGGIKNSEIPTVNVRQTDPQRSQDRQQAGSIPSRARQKVQPVQLNRLKKEAARSILGWERLQQRIGESSNKFIAKLLPGAAGRLPRISTGSMIMISILVPVIVVSIAMTVYIRTGRIEQHTINLQMAQAYAQQAAAASGATEQRDLFNQAMDYLEQAEHYGIDEETLSLREQLQTRLDVLEGVTRLSFAEIAPTGMPSGLNLIRIASFGDDLYVLDSGSGQILRITRLGRSGYVVDADFICGPAAFGELTVGPLIDMVGLPPNTVTVDVRGTPGATVMGLDASGNVIYCAPGNSPRAAQLGTPSLGWGTVEEMALSNQDTLTVLDSMSNRVWRFDETSTEDAEGNVTSVEDLTFSSQPASFFDNEVPDRLDEVIDLVQYNEYLYLLRSDTTLERCEYSHLKEIRLTECNPAVLQDMRLGDNPVPFASVGMQFTQMQVVTIPDIGIYILESGQGDLYKFGVDLGLYQILRPGAAEGYRLPNSPVTAFTITRDQYVYVVYGNQIFFARIR